MNKPILDQVKIFVFVLIIAIIVTLINPFGIGVYFESFRHFGNPMEKYIAEWTPLQQFSDLWWRQIIVGIFIMLGVVFLSLSGKGSAKFPYIGLAILLFFLPFWERRYAWPSYYLILPILQPLSAFFKPDRKKITIVSASYILLLTLCSVIIIKYPFYQFINFSWKQYCENNNISCSPQSAEYLLNHKLNVHHNLYTLYGWGGWLIWNYPQIKPTIDGRMSFWIDEDGYSGFKEYYWIEQDLSNIDKTKYDVAYMSPEKPVYNRLILLVKEGKWKLVYKDDFAGIFVRSK